MSAATSIAVIVTTGSAPAQLQMALESARNQTRPPERIIVVDRAEDAGATALVASLGATRVAAGGLGLAAARNLGLKQVSTEFVAFLDAADWFEPVKLEKSLELLQALGAVCLATDAWLVDGDRVEQRCNEGRPVSHVLTQEALIVSNPVLTSSVVCRNDALQALGGFDESAELDAAHEYDLWLRLAHREPLAYAGEPLLFHRRRPGAEDCGREELRGLDRAFAKIVARHAGEPHFTQLVARRRAAARLEIAQQLLRRGQRDEARTVIDEARRLSPSWRGFGLWARSLFARRRSVS